MKKSLLAATLLSGLAIAACKKDSNNTTTPPPVEPPTSTQLVTGATWKIDTIAFDANKDGTIDTPVPGGFQECDLDNTLSFKADSTGLFDEGGLKCSDTIPQSVPFVWMFKNSDKVININGALPGELHGDVNIIALTDTTFVMSKEVAIGGSATTRNLIIALRK